MLLSLHQILQLQYYIVYNTARALLFRLIFEPFRVDPITLVLLLADASPRPGRAQMLKLKLCVQIPKFASRSSRTECSTIV